MVEFEFLSLKDISISSARLSWSRGNASKQNTLVQLFLNCRLNFVRHSSFKELEALVLLVGFLQLIIGLPGEVDVSLFVQVAEIVSQKVLFEWLCVNSDNCVFKNGVCSDVFVI